MKKNNLEYYLNKCLENINVEVLTYIIHIIHFSGKETKEKIRKFLWQHRNNNNILFLRAWLYDNNNKYSKAIEYYTKSAEGGNIMALNNLGFIYEQGKGSDINYDKAREYYLKGANNKNSESCNNLGNLYLRGNGVMKDYSKAIEYYGLSLEYDPDNVSALTNLGFAYQTIEDYNKAVEYYTIAAAKKGTFAMWNLGNLYEFGIGVKTDKQIALIWYEGAAELGDEMASQKVKELNKYNK